MSQPKCSDFPFDPASCCRWIARFFVFTQYGISAHFKASSETRNRTASTKPLILLSRDGGPVRLSRNTDKWGGYAGNPVHRFLDQPNLLGLMGHRFRHRITEFQSV